MRGTDRQTEEGGIKGGVEDEGDRQTDRGGRHKGRGERMRGTDRQRREV